MSGSYEGLEDAKVWLLPGKIIVSKHLDISEFSEVKMEFKSGCGWRCCYDPETGLYTAEIGAGTNHNLYEITEEVYDLADASDAEGTKALIRTGRHLYMTVNDRCGLPYTVVLDSDYKKLCPWAETVISGEIWDEDLTDAAVELFESEEKNRDQRRAKRAERQNESDKKQ